MAQWVKNPPAIRETQETQVPSLGREDPLEKEKATQSSILAWKILWTEEPSRLHGQWGHRVGHNGATTHKKRRAPQRMSSLFFLLLHPKKELLHSAS